MQYGTKQLNEDELGWCKDNIPRLVQEAATKVNEAINYNGSAKDIVALYLALTKPAAPSPSKPSSPQETTPNAPKSDKK